MDPVDQPEDISVAIPNSSLNARSDHALDAADERSSPSRQPSSHNGPLAPPPTTDLLRSLPRLRKPPANWRKILHAMRNKNKMPNMRRSVMGKKLLPQLRRV